MQMGSDSRVGRSPSEMGSQRRERLDHRPLHSPDVLIGEGPIIGLQTKTVGQTPPPFGDRLAPEYIEKGHIDEQRTGGNTNCPVDRRRG